MKNIFQSPTTKKVLWIIGGALTLLLVFAAGTAIGYRRAIFASHWGENYYENFQANGVPARMMGLSPLGMHGVTGEVIDVSSGTLAVQDPDGNEESVFVGPSTTIRDGDDTIFVYNISDGSQVTVIGGPNAAGQIEARFIRVFDSASSAPPLLIPLPPAQIQSASAGQ